MARRRSKAREATTCDRCLRRHKGPKWEVVAEGALRFIDPPPAARMVVCPGCAHDFARKRQVPADG